MLCFWLGFDLLLHTESGVDKMPSGQLIADMETAKDSLWRKHGRTLCFISRTFPLWQVCVPACMFHIVVSHCE